MKTKETEKLDDIIQLNEAALKQYNILAKLEIQGQKDSEEYHQVIKNLQLISEVIEKKINSLQIDDKDLLDYENNLAKKHDYEDEDILVETLFQNNHDLAAKRLSMQIFNYSLINYCYYVEDEYIAEEYQDYREEIAEYMEEDEKKEIDFELIKDRLITSTFLAYLEEAIKNETDNDVKELLIKTKYNVLYLICSVEPKFLRNQEEYVNPTLIQNIITLQQDKVDIEEDFIIPNEETIMMHLEYMAAIPNNYYRSLENNVKVYLLSLYIKTLLSINISKKSDIRLNKVKETIKAKCHKSQDFINEAYNISKTLSVVKKVDL